MGNVTKITSRWFLVGKDESKFKKGFIKIKNHYLILKRLINKESNKDASKFSKDSMINGKNEYW